MPKEASVTSLQTITGNLMDLRERRSAALMRNPERYSPSATAWLRWGPEACWHDRLDVDYLAVFKPTNRRGADSRWASAPRSPGCESLWAAPRRACWSSPWWWRCSSSWGCSRGLTSSSSASCSTQLKAQLQEDRDEGGWQDEGSWKLRLLFRKRLGMQQLWPITDWHCHCVFLTDAQGEEESNPPRSFIREVTSSPHLRLLLSSQAKLTIWFQEMSTSKREEIHTLLCFAWGETPLSISCSIFPVSILVGKCSTLQDVWGCIKTNWVRNQANESQSVNWVNQKPPNKTVVWAWGGWW